MDKNEWPLGHDYFEKLMKDLGIPLSPPPDGKNFQWIKLFDGSCWLTVPKSTIPK